MCGTKMEVCAEGWWEEVRDRDHNEPRDDIADRGIFMGCPIPVSPNVYRIT